MKWLASVLVALFIAGAVHAQSQPVTVVGPITPGDCTKFQSVTVLADAGACGGGGTGSPGGGVGNVQYNAGAGVFGGLTDPQLSARMVSGTTVGQVLFNNSGVFGSYSSAQLTNLINIATASLSGALPAWPNNTTTFFRGDGTYATLSFPAIGGSVSCAQLPALTGDITSSSCATTLAAVNANVGTWGDSTHVPTLTINAKGLITAASQNTFTYDAGNLTGNTLAANVVSSSLVTVGTLGAGAAGSGFTIQASNASWTGTIPRAQIPIATSTLLGGVIPDGSSITVDGAGHIAAPGSGGGTVANCPLNDVAYYAVTGTTTACVAAVSSAILTTSPTVPAFTTSLPTGFGINGSNITWSGTIPAGTIGAINIGATGNGGITGTTLQAAVVNSSLTSVGSLTSLSVLGNTATTGTTINNLNSASDLVAKPTGTVMAIEQADGVSTVFDNRCYGGVNVFCEFIGEKSGGTLAARTAVQSGDKMAQYLAGGWDGTAYFATGGITFHAEDTFSGTQHGTDGKIALIKTGTITEIVPQFWNASGNIGMGLGDVTSPQAPLTITANTKNAAPVTAAAMLQLINADGSSTVADLDSYGGVSSMTFRAAAGTAASPTGLGAGVIGQFAAIPYNSGGAFNTFASPAIFFNAAQAQTGVNQGTSITFMTTPNGSTSASRATALTINASGGVSVDAAADPGQGNISVSGVYKVGATSGLSVTKTVRAAGGAADCTLIFTGGLLTGGSC